MIDVTLDFVAEDVEDVIPSVGALEAPTHAGLLRRSVAIPKDLGIFGTELCVFLRGHAPMILHGASVLHSSCLK